MIALKSDANQTEAFKQITATRTNNLFNIYDKNAWSSSVAVDTDGWVSSSGDNTTGTSTIYRNFWTSPMQLKPSTNYLLVLEVAEVSGKGAVNVTGISGASPFETQIATSVAPNFNALQSGGVYVYNITTIDDFSRCVFSLRSFGRFGAGESGSFKVRISIIEDLTITPQTFAYEAFLKKNIAYKNEVLYVNLAGHEPLRAIGDIADYIDYANQRIVRNIGTYTFNGSENWVSAGLTPLRVYIGSNYGLFNAVRDIGLSNRYKVIPMDRIYTTTEANVLGIYGQSGVQVRTAQTTLQAFKDELASENLIIQYQRTTPIYENITIE